MRIGVDVLGMAELDRLQGREWFRRYVYTDTELALADALGPGRAREFLAGRFAAKEAVLKVLGTGCGHGITPRQVCVGNDGNRAPVVRLSGGAAQRAAELGLVDVAVSIAHKADCVVVVAAAAGEADHDAAALHDSVAVAAETALGGVARLPVGFVNARQSEERV